VKKSCIIGSKGQDGQLLSRRLAEKNCLVSGIGRGDLDITKSEEVAAYLRDQKPDELYYLPAYHQSSQDTLKVADSTVFEKCFAVHVQGVVAFLEGIRSHSYATRVFYAASSHVFGSPEISPQNESTPFRPENIYGISKAAGVEACRYYRKKYGMFVVCGILYNHESALNSERFVMKKVIMGALRIARHEQEFLVLGDLDAVVDWGHAQDYTEAMIHTLSQNAPADYIIATGTTHTVRELVEIVFTVLGLDWKKHVKINPDILTKPTAVLTGDATKLRASGWQPKFDFPTMVKSILAEMQNSGTVRDLPRTDAVATIPRPC